MSHKKYKKLIIISGIVIFAIVCVFVSSYFFSISFDSTKSQSINLIKNSESTSIVSPEIDTNSVPLPISHIATPENVKAIYISAWVAGSAKHMQRIYNLLDTTELNAIVIDVKDSTGRVSFHSNNTLINELGSSEKRIADINKLIEDLHAKNIYVIGRVSVFQDPYMTKKMPDWAVKRKSDGAVWKDRKGLSFLDPANKAVWDYIVAVGQNAYSVGFDEINFDYIRYPSDGNIKDINYRLAEGKTRASNIEDFFIYLHDNMKKDIDIPTSADLFGLVTTSVGGDDMGIGQILEKALPHFDFIAPMAYPSHFAIGWNGYKNPASKPYEVVNLTMKKAAERTIAMGYTPSKIRPWLQDFDMGATYTKEMVRAQIKATNDAGLNSWMLWDPKNIYTKDALELN
ncbi:putative glycoside hydrolase [Candidatus Nomurabacteria bacterium]|nr:putative glycoside hydrolase [Candidatus Nomurabacteria bacterium]